MRLQLIDDINIRGGHKTWIATIDCRDRIQCCQCQNYLKHNDWAYLCIVCKKVYCYNCRSDYMRGNYSNNCTHSEVNEKRLIRISVDAN